MAASPAVAEAYAVLTRLPAPYRVSANDAHALVAASFLEGTDLAALDRALALGVAGGLVYDLLMAECACQTGVDVLLTFNARHFRRLTDPAIDIVIPGEAST